MAASPTPITTRQYGPDPKNSPISFSELDNNTLYFKNAPVMSAGYLPIANPTVKSVDAGGGITITYPVGYTVTESILRQVGGFNSSSITLIDLSGSLVVTESLTVIQTASFTYGTGSLTGTMTGFTTGTFIGQATGAFDGSGSGIFTGSMTGFITGTLGGVFTGSVSGSSDGLIFVGGKGITLLNSDITGSGTDVNLIGASTFNIDGTSSFNGYLTTQNTQLGNSVTDVHGVSGSSITFNTFTASFNGLTRFNGPIIMPAGNTIAGGPASFAGDVSFSGSIQVSGAATFNNSVKISNTHSLDLVSGPLRVGGTTTVAGNTSLSSSLCVGSNTYITGTLEVTGAVGLGSTLTVGGATQLNSTLGVTGIASSTNTTDATSTSTGAIKTSGGVGIAKALWVGGLVDITGAATIGGATQLNSTLGITGIHTSTNATDSTSTGNGSIITAGGVGIAKALWVGGLANISGVVTLQNTTQATSTSTGAIISSGGMGLAKNLWVGGNLNVAGTVSLGTITGTLVNALTVDDSSLEYTTGTTYDNSAARTIRIKATGVTNAMLAGSIANAKLVNSSVTVGTTAISLGSSSTTLAGLTSVTSTGFTGALTGNADTATKFATGRTIAMTGDVVWTSPAFDGSGNVTAASTIQPGVVTNAMLAGSIANGKLANSTISGKSLGANLDTLTIGTGLSGTSYNGSAAVTIANTGVTSAVAGTNIGVSSGTGAVTISVSNSPTFSGNATAAGFFQSSKRELKTNISKFEKSALDIINNTEVVEFNYKNDLDTLHIGIIADDSPEEIATKNHDKFDTNSTVAILLKAVQEMSAEIKELKEQLANK